MILDGSGNCVVPIVLETLSVRVQAPATVLQDVTLYPNAVVSVAVDASSNKGPVTTVCTLDGKSAPCVGNINMKLGSNTFVAIATSVATGATRTDSTTIVVLPLQIVGHVYVRTMTGEHCPSSGSYVIAGNVGSIQDSTFVDASTCAFVLNTRYAGTPNTRVVFQGDPNAIGLLAHVDQKYYGRLDMETMDQCLTIPLGQFAGQRKCVNLDLPYLPSGDLAGTSFFYRYWSGTAWEYSVWNFPKYPVPEQFCRNLSNQPITAKDSSGYSALMIEFHTVFGQEFFRMDPSTNVCTTGLGGRQLYVNDSLTKISHGGAYATDRSSRDLIAAGLNFASEAAIQGHYEVLHESIHGLGFGHASPNAWQSIMCAGSCGVGHGSNDITVDDVFWFYVMQTMANGERLHNTPFGLPQAHQFWRVSHKESEEPVLVSDPKP